MSRFVHRRKGADHDRAAQLGPPCPAALPGKGYPLSTLEHRRHELYFASSEAMAHVAGGLGERVLAKSCVPGAGQAGEDSHWLPRMDKASFSWKVRRGVWSRLRGA